MFRFDKDVRVELISNWQVLLVGFCCLLFVFAAPAFSLPFLFKEVIEEFGWSRGDATLLASAKYLIGTFAALVIGRFIDVIGLRVVLVLAILIEAAALISFLWVSSLPTYYLAGGLLGLAGPGAFIAIKVLISRTFHASQGTAMGIVLLGSSIGMLVIPIVVSALIDSFGWRYAIAAMSLGALGIALPMMFMRFFTGSLVSPTKDLEAAPISDSEAVEFESHRLKTRAESRAALKQIIRSGSFWLIAGAVFLSATVDQAFTQHQVLIFNDVNISGKIAAIGISVMGALGMVCRVILGNILDSKSNKGAAALYLMLSIASILALFLGDPLVLFAYIITRAIGHTTLLLDTTVLTKHAFGLANYGTLIGIYTAFHNFGYATGPWLMGRLHDMSGSYVSSFILFAIAPIIASILIWFMNPAYRPVGRSQHGGLTVGQ